jgi:GR25 family glycosyltransferase involved in LPS biosynthesis
MPEAASSPPAFWNRLDGIAVVNLDDRPDRWDQMRADSAPFLIGAPPLSRVSAVRGSLLAGYGKRPWFRGKSSDKRWAAKVGCTQSHRKVMEFARSQGWKTFLVLEDDADFSPLAGVDLVALEELLFTSHPDWEVCYLGFSKAVGTSLQLATFNDRLLCEVNGCYTTHAYIVRTSARDWIFDQLADNHSAWSWHSRHRIIDRWYVRHLSRVHRVFAVSPSIITQADGFSDIVQRPVNYNEEFAGRLEHLTTDPRKFRRLKMLRNAAAPFNDACDSIRGFIKRIKGF